MPTVTVHENQLLELPLELREKGIEKRLYRISNAMPSRVFEYSRGRLKASSVVGIICDKDLRIEILPKTATTSDTSEDRRYLLRLLHYSGYTIKYHSRQGSVAKSKYDLLESMITEVASELLKGLIQGVPRRYAAVSEESSVIKGRIEFSELVSRLPHRMERLPIRYHPLSPQNKLSQMIKWTALNLLKRTRSSRNREILTNAADLMPDVTLKGFTRDHVRNIELNRFEECWSRTLSVARLLASENTFDPTSTGREDVFSMIFPLQHVFETTLRKILRVSLKSTWFDATHRSESIHLLEDCYNSREILRLRPDYLFKNGSTVVAVGDAKWKRLKSTGRSHGAIPADFYQLMTYMTKYNVNSGLLFFPAVSWMKPHNDLCWTHSFILAGSAKKVHLVAIDLQSMVSPDRPERQREVEKVENTLLSIFE